MAMPADGGQKDAQPDHQGRRPGFGRSAALARRIALHRGGRHPRHPGRRRRRSRPTTSTSPRHRTRCSSASTSGPTSRSNGLAENRSRSTCASTRLSTTWKTTSRRPWSGCSRRSSARSCSAGPKCARSSRSRKVGTIAGCYVTVRQDSSRNAKVRVIRDSAVVFDGELESLRRFKDDVREVAENFECGIQVAKFADLKQGDVIEAYTLGARRSGAAIRPEWRLWFCVTRARRVAAAGDASIFPS